MIPLDDALLYAEPVYLQAERSPMPELRLVVLVTHDRLAYATRFPEALNALLKGPTGAPAESASTPAPAAPSSTTQAPALPQLIERANRAVADYQRLTSEGKLGEAGQKLEELKRTLEEMNRAGRFQ